MHESPGGGVRFRRQQDGRVMATIKRELGHHYLCACGWGFWRRRRWLPARFPVRCPKCRRRAKHVCMLCAIPTKQSTRKETR